MKKITQFLISVFILAVLITPALSLAVDVPNDQGSGLIPCTNDCDFTDLMTLINTVIKFVLFKLALPLAAIMFAYAGVKLVASGGSPEARSSAKNIFTNTAVGLILAAGAFIIVKTVLIIAGYQSMAMFFK